MPDNLRIPANEREMLRIKAALEDPNRAFQTMAIHTEDDGSVTMTITTNDDNDDGYPDGEIVTWSESYRTVTLALHHAGKSRFGISGVAVYVTLDDQPVLPNA